MGKTYYSAMTLDAIGAGIALEHASAIGINELDGPNARAYISGLSLTIRHRLHAGDSPESIRFDLKQGVAP